MIALHAGHVLAVSGKRAMLETKWNGTDRVGRSCLTVEGGMNPFFSLKLIKHGKLRVTGADLLDSR